MDESRNIIKNYCRIIGIRNFENCIRIGIRNLKIRKISMFGNVNNNYVTFVTFSNRILKNLLPICSE